MASTKYRKREKSSVTEDKAKLPKSKPARIDNKVLDAPGDSMVDSGDDLLILSPGIFELKKQSEISKNHECKIETKELENTEEKGENILDTIRIEDDKNVFEIKLLKKANRLTRVAFFLNGIETRPHTYAGHTSGISYFHLLKLTQKK